jgi:hypothetical protein
MINVVEMVHLSLILQLMAATSALLLGSSASVVGSLLIQVQSLVECSHIGIASNTTSPDHYFLCERYGVINGVRRLLQPLIELHIVMRCQLGLLLVGQREVSQSCLH